jgi:hypothetical protein
MTARLGLQLLVQRVHTAPHLAVCRAQQARSVPPPPKRQFSVPMDTIHQRERRFAQDVLLALCVLREAQLPNHAPLVTAHSDHPRF